MRRLSLVLLALLTASPVRAQWSPAPAPVRASRGMVVSAERNASEAGVAVMRAGGNAVDAAVATGFALAVTFPVAGNIGGGGFLVVRFPDGTATTLDFRETAPAAATRDMFLDSTGTFVPVRSQVGALASGVPGSVAGLVEAHARWGRLPLVDVLAPAIALAERGFPLSRDEAERLNAFRTPFSAFPSTSRAFVPAVPYADGDTLRQPDLAAVLARIRAEGRDGFYTGETARLIAAEMERNDGLITLADLAGYRPVERPPVVGMYRGHRVISMGPPSSGGTALLQMLASVEPFDVRAMGFNSSATVHLMGEAMRRAYADRAEWLGDPDFVSVPVAGLIDTAYVRSRMATFDPASTTSSDTIAAGAPPHESDQTTHYSVVDADGMAVSVTTTLNGAYGSGLVVGGAGFLLNNEMDDFAAAPGVPNQFGLVGNAANAVAPGKRMLSSMTPTIVEGPDGRLRLVVGSPGGGRIITTVFEAILNVVDHGMTVSEAVAAPRVHHQWLPDVLFAERGALARDVADALRARGWAVVEEDGHWSRADAVLVACDAAEVTTDPSGLAQTETLGSGCVLLGGADPRGEDTAVGF
ncbi:MAG TPA: gamma-glutamyltransferase [Rubricoccaceae bacterium]|jgi:gamma-glutamyltranspeptidase/glutathione hydrolase